MTWTYEIDWQGYRLTLNREAGHIPVHRASTLPAAPGAGEIRFPALFLYSNGSALHLEAEISGSKIARVFLESYWETHDGWLAGPIHRRELTAPQNKLIGGVEIPLWAETNKLSAAWQPEIRILLAPDRQSAAWVFPQPSRSNPVELWLHALIGTGHPPQPVRLYFSEDGELRRMALLNSDLPGGTRGLLPQAGDQLTPAFDWLRQEGSNWHTASGSANAIPVSEQLPQLATIPAPPGRYQVGLLAYDLDGQAYRGLVRAEI